MTESRECSEGQPGMPTAGEESTPARIELTGEKTSDHTKGPGQYTLDFATNRSLMAVIEI